MPIYEYRCDGCGNTFEVKQSMKDDPVATCASCGKQAQRLISSPAIMFKGSGWYITDYSDKMKPPTGGEPADKGAGEKKDSAATAPATTATPATPAPTAPSTSAASSTSSSTSTSTTSAPATSSTTTK